MKPAWFDYYAPRGLDEALHILGDAGPDGRVYLGAVDELGDLDRDERGATRSVSLLSQLPQDLTQPGDIGSMAATADAITGSRKTMA